MAMGDPAGGGNYSGGTQGQGEGYGEGYGEEGTLLFRYRLVGYKWTWTSKTGDPRTWTGTGAEYDISATDYVYGSAQDALDAGKAIGDSNTDVMRVFSEPNRSGFAGLQHTYSDRLSGATNAPAAESQAAYEEYIKEGTLVLEEEPSGMTPLAGLFIIALIVGIGIIGFKYLSGVKMPKVEVPEVKV